MPAFFSIHFLVPGKFGIQLFHASGTDAMRKIEIRMALQIGFNLYPVSIIIAYILAAGTDGEQPSQCFYIIQCLFQFRYQSFLLSYIVEAFHGISYGAMKEDAVGPVLV